MALPNPTLSQPALFPSISHSLPLFVFPPPSSQSPLAKPSLQNVPISCNMLPTFHMNNFKPWAPPHTKPFSPHESLNSRSSRTSNLPRPKPRHDSFPSTLPFPKHHLPAPPPAEVCVHISTNTPPRTPLSSQFQPQEISVPPLSTPYSENPKQGTTSPHDPAPRTSNSDPISSVISKRSLIFQLSRPSFGEIPQRMAYHRPVYLARMIAWKSSPGFQVYRAIFPLTR